DRFRPQGAAGGGRAEGEMRTAARGRGSGSRLPGRPVPPAHVAPAHHDPENRPGCGAGRGGGGPPRGGETPPPPARPPRGFAVRPPGPPRKGFFPTPGGAEGRTGRWRKVSGLLQPHAALNLLSPVVTRERGRPARGRQRPVPDGSTHGAAAAGRIPVGKDGPS